MKKYIKPNFSYEDPEMEPLLSSNSILGVTVDGADDLKVSDEDFSGGNADSRDNLWDDDNF